MDIKRFEWFNLTVYEIYVWWQDKGVGGQGWFYTAFGRHGKPHDELAAGRIEGCESDDLDGAIERTIWELGGVLNPDMFARDPVIGCAFWTRSESTPGPWRLDGDDFKLAGPRYHRIAAGHGYSDPNPDKISRGFGLTGVISYPDALLMASAPALLKALAAVVDWAKKTDEPLPNSLLVKAIETIDNATTPESRQALLP